MRTKTLLLSAAALLAAGIVSSQAQAVYSQNIVGYASVVLQPGVYEMIANPFTNGNNSASNVLTGLQGGENVSIWNGHGYYQYNYLGLGNGTGAGGISDWQDISTPTNIPGDVALPPPNQSYVFAPTPVLPPGQAFFVQNLGSAETNTFTGVVATTNSVALAPGVYTMLASAIPVGGDISNGIINLTQSLQGGETVFVWNGHGYYQYNYLGAGNGTGAGGISDWQDVSSPTNIPGDVALPPPNGSYVFAPDPSLTVGQGFFILNSGSSEQWTQSYTNH
jgi:hypothetical protein